MQISVAGLLLAAALYVMDYAIGGQLLLALLASLAFGATAFALVPGGSSPLIYTLFAIGLTVSVVLRRSIAISIREVFAVHPISWIVLLLMVYVMAGAYFLPRIFQDDMLVYIRVNSTTQVGGSTVSAMPLVPNAGNITQGCYFLVGTLAFFATSVILLDPVGLESVRKGAFALAILVTLTGLVDLLGKMVGLGDILEPIRTANYAMMTGEEFAIGGFLRINGAFSEASAYAAALTPSLAFTLAYWRVTGDRLAFILTIVLVGLLALSTSTTAYVTAAICGLWLAAGIVLQILLCGTVRVADLIIAGLSAGATAVMLAILFVNEKLLAPLFRMIDLTIINKASSDSAIERGSWNAHAIQNLIESNFAGVGIGSSRTSSWLIAVVSHLGVPGALTMIALVIVLVRGLGSIEPAPQNRRLVALAAGSRAAALSGLVGLSVSSATSDPGILFFIMLATVIACRHHLTISQPGMSRRGRSLERPITGMRLSTPALYNAP